MKRDRQLLDKCQAPNLDSNGSLLVHMLLQFIHNAQVAVAHTVQPLIDQISAQSHQFPSFQPLCSIMT